MIKVAELTPSIYYDHSRDFQFLGRLYESVFNYIKTNEDSIYNIPSPDILNKELLELLSFTLGFKSKHDYPLNQLRAVCGCLSTIIKNKGTKRAVEIIIKSILRAEDISDRYDVALVQDEITRECWLRVVLPPDLSDRNLYNDLLDYVIPAGLRVETYYATLLEDREETIHYYQDDYTKSMKADFITSIVPKNNENGLDEMTGPGKIDNSTAVGSSITITPSVKP